MIKLFFLVQFLLTIKVINAGYKWYNGKSIKCLENSFSIRNTIALIVTTDGEMIQYTNNHKLGIFNVEENYGSFTVSANGIGGKLLDYNFNFKNDPVYHTLINENTTKISMAVITVNKSSNLLFSFYTGNRFKIFYTNKNSPNLFKEYSKVNSNINSLILISSKLSYQDVLLFKKISNQWHFQLNNNSNNKTVKGFICEDFYDPNKIIFEQNRCNQFDILDRVQSAFVFGNTIYLFSFKNNLVWTLNKKLFIDNKSAKLTIHKISNLIECNKFGKFWHWILIIMVIVISPLLCYFMFDTHQVDSRKIVQPSTHQNIHFTVSKSTRTKPAKLLSKI